ncbi:MAG TPA: TlpA disulfide reductase family protein [Verrucomicrobiae bacterium]|nr:TlpA disulfide reductase family protein [Verrucomicrobiae bacterium]
MNTKLNTRAVRLAPSLLIGLLASLVALVLLNRAFGQGDHFWVRHAPDFALKNTDGDVVKLDDFTGKTLAVCFIVTSDKPSLRQIAILSDWLKEHDPKKFAVLGLSIEQWGSQTTKAYVDQDHPSFPFLIADYETIRAFGGLTAVPTTFVIDKDQNIIQQYVGVTKKEVLDATFAAASPQ